jgi:RNA-directed DNA polymerase
MSSLPLLVSLPDVEESLGIIADELEFTPDEQELAKSLLEKKLPPLVKPNCLPFLFAISHQLIGLMEKSPHLFYRSFVVRKKSGGYREIEAPRRFLKTIQQWIYEYICSKANLSNNVKGFVRGQSIFDNARVHAKNRNLMVLDISDFFPSVTFAQVENVFKDFGYPTRVQHQLAALCCLNGHLPQGAPTSPSLANLVFKQVDEELSKLAKEWKCDYTRYADDLAFSGNKVFSKPDIADVEKILGGFGFSLNQQKSRIIGQGGQQIVAGLIVNNNALPPRVNRRRWRATFHRANRYPKEFVDKVNSLFGIASFVNQFSSETSAKYREIANTVLQHR